MPTATLDDCRKDSSREDYVEWNPPKAKVNSEKEMWNRLSRVPSKDEKKCDVRWAINARAQYEPAKRAIRAFKWRHRPRHENLAARLFYREAEQWKNDTMHWSSMTKMIAHPSYLRIIGLGRQFKEGEIEGLILREMQNEPDHWFDALAAITGENPVGPNDDFDQAVNAWLEWGRQKRFITIENDYPRRA